MSTTTQALFTPFRLGALELRNRIVMAPLTRDRATHGTDAPRALNVEYYAQRASAGLIISEATQISPQGKGYAWTPGIFSPEQIAGWTDVTNAVHALGGAMFLQLWHVGRFSHPSLQPNGETPVAPSAIAPKGQKTFVETDGGGYAEVGTPRALDTGELPGIVDDYRRAAENAMRAGFDGVEIHGANGYLLDQFLRETSNVRDDAYGGSVSNRLRFPLEVVDAVAETVGAARTGIRISPTSTASGTIVGDAFATYGPFVDELSKRALAYVHVVEGVTGVSRETSGFDFAKLRARFAGAWMVNNGYTRDLAERALESGYADLVAFGRPFVSNPDLVERFLQGVPTNDAIDQERLYGGDAEGYTTYPRATG